MFLPLGRVKIVQLLSRETPDFIAPTLSLPQPSRLPDLRKLQERVYRSRIHDVAQLKSRFIEEWEHVNQMIS